MSAPEFQGIRLRGLSEMGRRLQATRQEISYAARIASKRTALKARAIMRETVPGKRFDDSIVEYLMPNRTTYHVGSIARLQTAQSIQEGRPVGKPPSIKQLRRWIESRGLAGSVSIRTRRVSRRKLKGAAFASHDRAVQGMAYRLQREIARRGTRAIPYLTTGAQVAQADLDRYMREGLEKAMAKFRKGVA